MSGFLDSWIPSSLDSVFQPGLEVIVPMCTLLPRNCPCLFPDIFVRKSILAANYRVGEDLVGNVSCLLRCNGAYTMSWKSTVLVFVLTITAIPEASQGSVMYSGDSARKLWTTDLSNGNSVLVGTMQQLMFDIAFDGSGDLFGVSSAGSLYRINPANAVTSLIGSGLGVGVVNALEYSATDSQMYGANQSGGFFSINTVTGVATSIGSGSPGAGGDLAEDAAGVMYMSSINTLVKVDKSTGRKRPLVYSGLALRTFSGWILTAPPCTALQRQALFYTISTSRRASRNACCGYKSASRHCHTGQASILEASPMASSPNRAAFHSLGACFSVSL